MLHTVAKHDINESSPFMGADMWSTVRKRPWGSSPNSSDRCSGGISSSDRGTEGSPYNNSSNNMPPSAVGGATNTRITRIGAVGSGLALNRMVCDFSNQREIGGGDFGLVTSATYDVDKQRYAIKSLRKAVTGEADLQRRLQEVYALSACKCPHLLRYYDSWFEDGIVYLQTEFVDGGSILSRDIPWDEGALWDLLRQVAIGLQAMHSAKIAHLDIKPDNILMSPCDSQPFGTIYKIGDFGLARPIDREQFYGMNDDEGDCRYLCPVFLAHGVEGVAGFLREADMYSLGASIVHLTGGEPRTRRLHYETLDHYSEDFQQLIYALISQNPPERPTAAQVVETCQSRLSSWETPPIEVQQGDSEVALLREQLAALEAEEVELDYLIECEYGSN